MATAILTSTALLAIVCFIWYRIYRRNKIEQYEIALFQYQVDLKSALSNAITRFNNQFGTITHDIIINPSKRFYQLRIENHILIYDNSKVAIINGQPIKFCDIINFSITDDTTTIANTTARTDNSGALKSALGWSMLLGKEGAVIGALSADSTSYEESHYITYHNYTLYLTLNNIKSPIIKVAVGCSTDTKELLTSILSVIIHNNDKNRGN